MRRIEFSIENNEHLLKIGETVQVSEFNVNMNYLYLIQNSLGMSSPFKVSERLKTNQGKIIEIKKTERFNIAVLEFDE